MTLKTRNETFLTASAEETHEIAKTFGQSLAPNAVVAFFGDLGAGKTTFIRGLCEGAAHINPREISSPTFAFLNIYEGKINIHHFDLYRLPKEEEFIHAGFHEYLNAGGISCIEWSEKIPSFLPKKIHEVHISHLGGDLRQIAIHSC